jgi:DNA-binding transcriptional ArsR family regulator
MEGSILELLEQHGSLGYEQIAMLLAKPPDAVRTALPLLRESGLIDVLTVGALQGNLTNAASYWRLTEKVAKSWLVGADWNGRLGKSATMANKADGPRKVEWPLGRMTSRGSFRFGRAARALAL